VGGGRVGSPRGMTAFGYTVMAERIP
jgi:hypothetical protein